MQTAPGDGRTPGSRPRASGLDSDQGRADHARGIADLMFHNRGFQGVVEYEPRNLRHTVGIKRVKLRNTAADDNDVRIEDVDKVRHRPAEMAEKDFDEFHG